MPLLNDYAGAAVAAIHQHGGEVLKFMGDGILAIFRNDGERHTNLEAATHDALRALCQAQKNLREVRNRRANAGLPVADMTVALHVGDVLYGTFGGEDRIDFHVVGPAVNELSRSAGKVRVVDQQAILSAALRQENGKETCR